MRPVILEGGSTEPTSTVLLLSECSTVFLQSKSIFTTSYGLPIFLSGTSIKGTLLGMFNFFCAVLASHRAFQSLKFVTLWIAGNDLCGQVKTVSGCCPPLSMAEECFILHK